MSARVLLSGFILAVAGLDLATVSPIGALPVAAAIAGILLAATVIADLVYFERGAPHRY
jgi:hypothetical protein